jgi:hypothetical protein
MCSVIALLALLSCSSEEGEGSAEPDGGAPSSTGGPDAATGEAGGRDPYDPGCEPVKDGPRAGTTASSAPADGPGAPWTSPDDALTADDEAFASATLDDHDQTEELRVSGFGFQLPPGSRVTGIEVQLKRRAPEGGVVDEKIALDSNGRTGRYKYISSGWPSTVVGTHHYGQAVDPWGIELTPADVAAPDFAVTLRAKREAGAVGPKVANVDSLQMSVFYCQD